MENKDIDEIFKTLDFDVAEPMPGHQDRFMEKLKKQPSRQTFTGKVRTLWSPMLAIAASLLLIFMVAGSYMGSTILTDSGDLAGISPEMKQTQEFYTNLIKTELARVEQVKTPETQAIVEDAFIQLEKLDMEYENLKNDLKKSGQDKRVVFAMVSNLQQRIDVLNNVLTHIENINKLKNPNDENNLI